MSAHAFMSPSAFTTAKKCPASPLRQFQIEQLKELIRMSGTHFYGLTSDVDVDRFHQIVKEENDAADDGTKLHSVFEKSILEKITDKEDIRDLIEEEKLVTDMKGDEYILDQLTTCTNEQLEMLGEAEWVGVEERMWVTGLPQYGTVDLSWLVDEVLYVRDLKTGRLDVATEDNDQLMNYAVGLLDKHQLWDRVKTVKMKILGLRFKANEWEVNVKDLLTYKVEVMLPTFMAAYSINPEAVAGDHCLYCSAKVSCPEWQKKFKGLANKHFENGFEDLDVDEQIELYKLCKQAERCGKDLSKLILLAFEGFDEPQGIVRVDGRKRVDYVVSEDELVASLKKKKLVSKSDDLYAKKLLTPVQLKAKYPDADLEGVVKEGRNAPYLKIT